MRSRGRVSLDAPLGRRINQPPPRPNTAVRNFAMDTVQANVLQPLLEDMFIAQPADPVAYMSDYLGGVNADGAKRMSYLAAELADAHAAIARLESTLDVAAPGSQPSSALLGTGENLRGEAAEASALKAAAQQMETQPAPLAAVRRPENRQPKEEPETGADGPQPEVALEDASAAPNSDEAVSAAAEKRCILLYGPPGSGRGTQAVMIAQRFGFANIGSGTVLKQLVANDSALGLQAKEYMDRGEYVPDELIMQAIMPHISAGAGGFVLSGYPRTQEQSQALLAAGVAVDAVVVLDVPDWILSERAVMRRRDADTGKVYHMLHDEEQITPEIRERLVHLPAEDGEGNVEKRIALFRMHCAAVCDEFSAAMVHRVDGDRHEEEVFRDICSIVTGQVNESAGVDYNANRAETIVKKLPWTLRSEFHAHGPEIYVDNSEFFDPDPDMHTKRKTGHGRAPLVILHFNDVYEIKEGKQEPVGGASRIAGKMHEFDGENPLVLFSGDALNPSLLSQSTQGSHMIEVLNALGVACSVVGNHDLDFGIENMVKQIANSDFPWMCTNCWHKETGEPLAGAIEACVIQHQGYNIGVVGLIEKEWLACCATVDPGCLDFTDLVEAGRAAAIKLRTEEDVDFVVALTHFREPNDERLAAEVAEIDLVLGGHDHHYACKKTEPHGTWYVKSGADFRYLSKITMELAEAGRPKVTVEKHDITRDVPEDVTVKAICQKYLAELEATMGRTIGHLKCEIDARFAMVRTQETNCGNWCADVMRAGCKCDVVLLNSGTLRADTIYPPGKFTLEDLMKLLPFPNELMVVELDGKQLLHCLENSVSGWPKKEGRFVQVSGLKFEFDGAKEPFSRVSEASVMIGDTSTGFVPLNSTRKFSVGALDFAAKGNEGFTAFLDGTVLWDEEVCTPLGTLMRNNLNALEVLNNSSFAKRADSKRAAAKSFLHLSKSYRSRIEGDSNRPRAEEKAAFAVNPELEGRIINLASATK